MGFLDNDTIVVDAILTKYGRQLLAEGRAINPTHFALSDDGIDYTLWNTSSPSGSSGYDDYITKLPMTEAVPDGVVMMKYNLMSLQQNTRYLPTVALSNAPDTDLVYTLDNDVHRQDTVKLEPSLMNWSGEGAKYDFTIMDATGLETHSHDGTIVPQSAGTMKPQEHGIPYTVKIINATYLHLIDKIVVADTKTAIIITHQDSGAMITAYVRILKSDKVGGS